MNRSVIAALLSALVFPGAGHFYLRRPVRALAFLLPAMGAVLYFLSRVATQVDAMVGLVMSGDLPLDPVAIGARLENSGIDSPMMHFAIVVMIVCWIGAVVDSALLGRAARQP
jgi:hypothetical protein